MAEHGKHGGWKAHYRAGEPLCDVCLEGRRAYQASLTPTAEQRERKSKNARTRYSAVKELIRRHYPEFLRIQAELKEADNDRDS